MKLYTRWFLVAGWICYGGCLQAEPLQIDVKAQGAIVMNADSGAILYEKNAHALYHPASITKTATALYALKLKGDTLDQIVEVEGDDVCTISEEALRKSNYTLPSYWLTIGGTHIGLRKGERMTFRDLLYGLMLASGNDASNVIARYTAGSVPQFMAGLNQYLKEIGCHKTRFVNPHGLHHPEHQTTPYEMALITRQALKNPDFRKIVATTHHSRPKTNLQETATFVQHNKLLRSGPFKYSKAIGVKTGYHSHAQHTFVAAATHEGRTLIAVLMKAKERADVFNDSVKLFEAAFAQPKITKTLFQAGPQPYSFELKGGDQKVQTYLENNLVVSYYPAEKQDFKCFIEWDPMKLPVVKDQRVGVIIIQTVDGSQVATAPLLAQNTVMQTWWSWIKNMWGG